MKLTDTQKEAAKLAFESCDVERIGDKYYKASTTTPAMTSIKKQVYEWIEQNPETSTLNNLFAVFRRSDKTKEFGRERKITKSYLRQIYNQYIKEHGPKERYCRFCETMKPNSEILIVDTLSGRMSKFYCCKECFKNNEKTEKYRHYPTEVIKKMRS